jgi:hypothetical protein
MNFLRCKKGERDMEETVMKEKIDDYTCLARAINTKYMPLYHKISDSPVKSPQYSATGIHKMRQLCDEHEELTIWNGTKRMIKREKLEKFLEKQFSI